MLTCKLFFLVVHDKLDVFPSLILTITLTLLRYRLSISANGVNFPYLVYATTGKRFFLLQKNRSMKTRSICITTKMMSSAIKTSLIENMFTACF